MAYTPVKLQFDSDPFDQVKVNIYDGSNNLAGASLSLSPVNGHYEIEFEAQGLGPTGHPEFAGLTLTVHLQTKKDDFESAVVISDPFSFQLSAPYNLVFI